MVIENVLRTAAKFFIFKFENKPSGLIVNKMEENKCSSKGKIPLNKASSVDVKQNFM